MSRTTPIELQTLTGTIGAQVTGVDLSQDLDSETFSAITKALHDHLVLVFPGQDLTPAQQSEFSKRFGPAEPHPYGAREGVNNENPEVIVLETKPGRRGARNDFWHSDISASERPPALSFLHARIITPGRGDTMFCNMARAYDTLTDKMKAVVGDLQSVYDFTLVSGVKDRTAENEAELYKINPPVAHPTVRVHNESGVKALYVSERTSHFNGMSRAESAPIIQYLCEQATQPENVYRHQWRVGDVVFWDNGEAMQPNDALGSTGGSMGLGSVSCSGEVGCTGAARTKVNLGIFQGALVTLGPRGLRDPRGPQGRQGCLWGPGPPSTRPLRPWARVPW